MPGVPAPHGIHGIGYQMGDDHGDLFLIEHEGGDILSVADLRGDPLVLETFILGSYNLFYHFVEIIRSLPGLGDPGKFIEAVENPKNPFYLGIACIDGLADVLVQGFAGYFEHLHS